MKRHALHLLMCAPMIVVGFVFVALGGSVAGLLPVAGCVLMMWAMMRMMPGHGGDEGHRPDR